MNEKQKIFFIIYVIIITLWIYCMELAEQALTRICK